MNSSDLNPRYYRNTPRGMVVISESQCETDIVKNLKHEVIRPVWLALNALESDLPLPTVVEISYEYGSNPAPIVDARLIWEFHSGGPKTVVNYMSFYFSVKIHNGVSWRLVPGDRSEVKGKGINEEMKPYLGLLVVKSIEHL